MFDKIGKDDLIIAFFPCVRFEDQAILILKGNQWQQKNASDLKKLETDLKAHRELHDLYELVTKLAIVAIRNGLRLVIENPYSTQHYLQRYWCLSPAIIDKDRTKSGDYFKKPTQYWFVGFEKKDNFIFEPLEYVDLHTISNYQHSKNNNINGASTKVSRSIIHPQYANRFIREFIL